MGSYLEMDLISEIDRLTEIIALHREELARIDKVNVELTDRQILNRYIRFVPQHKEVAESLEDVVRVWMSEAANLTVELRQALV